jgi:hypothetical protein
MRLTPLRIFLFSVLAAGLFSLVVLVYLLANGADRTQALEGAGGSAAIAFLFVLSALLMSQERPQEGGWP